MRDASPRPSSSRAPRLAVGARHVALGQPPRLGQLRLAAVAGDLDVDVRLRQLGLLVRRRARLVQLALLDGGLLLARVGLDLLVRQPPLPELVEQPLDRVLPLVRRVELRLGAADQHRDAVDVVVAEPPAEFRGRARSGSPRGCVSRSSICVVWATSRK